MTRRVLSGRVVLSCVVLVGMVGCSGGKQAVPVSGRLTSGDKPCAGVGVNLVSDDPMGQSFIGSTNADGRFEMYSFHGKKGVLPGPYKVQISIPLDAPGGGLVNQKLIGQQSPWRVSITDKGLSDWKLDMTKEKLD
ncbi:MAG: hypothetical protein EBR86_13040 [Planctomycetia bacterium]|nr:hypothetical protein [Planctomycetia bacterium]